jgi:ABC-type protease/lipase transport system fused ATPase/permease subunit
MSEKVVLPKFDLPGKKMHPAVKMLLGAGVMLVCSIGVLVLVLWRHHSMEVAEENRKQAEIAAKLAQANAEAEAAKARQAEAAAQVAMAKAKAEAELAAKKKGAAAASSPSDDTKVASASGRHHGGHHGSSKSGSKTTTVAKAGADDKGAKTPSKGSTKKGDDVVDKLLASFK